MFSLKRLWPYIKRYKWRLIIGLAAVTISNAFAALIPKIIGQTIDRLDTPDTLVEQVGMYTTAFFQTLKKNDASWFTTYIEQRTHGITAGDIVEQVLWIIALSIIAGLFLFLTRQMVIVMSRLVERDLRNDFMDHVQSLSMRWFTTTTTGDIMALATNDIPRIREFAGPALMYSANTVTTFAFAVGMMFALSPKITLLALLPLPLVSYTVYKIGKKVHLLFGQVQGQYADLTSNAQENISGVRVIRGYIREVYAESVFGRLSELYRMKNMEYIKVDALMMPAMMTLIGLSQLIILGVGGAEVMAGRLTIGEITQFVAYLSMLIWPVIAIGWVTNLVQRAAAAAKRLNEVFDLKPDIADSAKTDRMITSINGKIEFRDVTLQYDPEMPTVLKHLNFTVEPGETLAIVGPTGSGKSSIVNLIARLYDPSEGDIFIDDKPIATVPLDTLRSSIGTVTQETFLFSKTIADNVRFGRTDADFDLVTDATSLAQLHENVTDFPEQYDTMVGERGVTLSGGQKQRTSIARAVLRQPSILILDDALSAVDTETEEYILRGLRDVMKDRTTILIAHRISTVKDADKIIVLEDGAIVENGTHDELIELGGRYASTYERQLLEQELEAM
ncbi:MAG: ABC transporter ATP-binding protein [Ignavibacteriae bacterium]|nr:ABC transporter ATP-binding protein [Ignavibacteriota bacterium]MCB9216465.1 ABC transporter ATP-binding protein [Ignavibacteria bacterium]